MKNKVKPYRQLAELTQAELAEKIGVSRQTIHAVEKGQYNPSILLVLKIASVLDKEVEELFLIEERDWLD